MKQNGCGQAEDEQELYQGSVTLNSWTGCRDKSEVKLYLLKDWGHVWPGSVFFDAPERGDSLKGFEAAEIIWDFFKRHHR